MEKTMKKILPILKRLVIVLYFLITIPFLGIIISEVNDGYLYDHQHYFSTNKVKEFAQILRYSATFVWIDKEVVADMNKTEDDVLVNNFMNQNIDEVEYWLKFLDGKIRSRDLAIKVGGYENIGKMDAFPKHYGKYIRWMILIDIIIVIGYIIITDLFIKIWQYIVSWKFKWGFDYKKYVKSLIMRKSKNE